LVDPVISFDVSNFVDWLGQVEKRIDDETVAAATSLAQDAAQTMHEHGYQNRTGRLTSSMTFRTMRTGGLGFLSIIEISAPYALWVDEPTKPHVIKARRAPFLVFKWRGSWHRRKSVFHPGTSGARFSNAAADYVEHGVTDRLQRAVDSAVQLTG